MYILQEEMPYSEFKNWMIYLNTRPVGWRDDNRAFLQIKAQGYKGKPTDLFPSLRPILEQAEAAEGVNTPMPKGNFLSMLLQAKNGDKEAMELFKSNGKK